MASAQAPRLACAWPACQAAWARAARAGCFWLFGWAVRIGGARRGAGKAGRSSLGRQASSQASNRPITPRQSSASHRLRALDKCGKSRLKLAAGEVDNWLNEVRSPSLAVRLAGRVEAQRKLHQTRWLKSGGTPG